MRVSTSDERQSVDLQRDALLGAGVDERHLHHDRASGARDDRPGLKACMADLREGDILVVWKLDRLGRSLSHLIRIVEELKQRGVAFRSLTEAIDTTSAHGSFLFNLFGTLAEYERALITERVNAGLAAARRRGGPGHALQTRRHVGDGAAGGRRGSCRNPSRHGSRRLRHCRAAR